MKKTGYKIKAMLVITLAYFLIFTAVSAQAPQKMIYQAVIRNNSNALIVSTNVTMRISILQGSSTGTAVYVEKQTALTNINGLASMEIGSGTVVSGTFAGIDWSAGPYFIKTETDPNGGTSYLVVNTSELLSAPYALYSANCAAGSLSPGTAIGNTAYWNGSQWVPNSNTIYNTGTNVGIGNGVIPAVSAKLDVSSTTQGTLITRMTTAQRDAIVSPGQSLLIYNITTKCFEFWENGAWQTFGCACPPPAQPGAITGTTPVCQGNSGIAYSVANVAGVTYTWTYSGTGYTQASGGNTNSITANFSGAATSGTLTVTPSDACGYGTAQTLAITVTPLPTFSYAATSYCSDANNPYPIYSGGGVAGVFSSTPGLVFISQFTGEINLSSCATGTYTVTDSMPPLGGCGSVSATSTITITTLPVATFSYAGTPYCSNASNPLPTFSGAGVAGVFSSTAGLVFVSSATGQVNLAASTAGTYTVTNTIPAAGVCGSVTATSTIVVKALPTIANAGTDIYPASGISTATLAGNTPIVGTGAWSLISGTATITNPASATSGVTGLALNGTATLRWTISNAPCTASTDDVVITKTACIPACGTQVFAAYNMNTGTQVPQATPQTPGQKWCYNDIAASCATYGGLYQWASAMNLPSAANSTLQYGAGLPSCDPCGAGGKQGICPAGFHIPTDLEWSRFEACIETTLAPTGTTTLATFQTTTGYRGTNSTAGPGAKMKVPSWNGSNTSGFAALPAGYSNGNTFSNFGAGFWSATEYSATDVSGRYLVAGDRRSSRNSDFKEMGFSVRCLQN